MKIRNGFVSNSSSSSFLVGFARKPKSISETHIILFEREYEYDGTCSHYCESGKSTMDIAVRVYNDLKSQRPIKSDKKILEVIRSGWYDGHPDIHSYCMHSEETNQIIDEFEKSNKDRTKSIWDDPALGKRYQASMKKEWDERDKILNAAAKKYFDEIASPILKGKKVFKFDYSDNDGEEVLEHGNIFSNLPHIVISHH